MNSRQAALSAQLAERCLELPKFFTLEALQNYLATERNREIVITEFGELPGTDVCGMWIGLQDRDVILHAPARAPLHRQQIVLHEFGHMILKHDVDAVQVEAKTGLIANIDSTTIRHVLLRSSFSDESELAAELLADRLSARIKNSMQRLAPEHLSFGEVFG